jgi:hypothetical protein
VVGRLPVRRSLWRGRVGTPKGGRMREVPLCDSAIQALKAHRPRTALKGPYAFSPDGGASPFNEADVLDVVARACHRAGLAKRIGCTGCGIPFASTW